MFSPERFHSPLGVSLFRRYFVSVCVSWTRSSYYAIYICANQWITSIVYEIALCVCILRITTARTSPRLLISYLIGWYLFFQETPMSYVRFVRFTIRNNIEISHILMLFVCACMCVRAGLAGWQVYKFVSSQQMIYIITHGFATNWICVCQFYYLLSPSLSLFLSLYPNLLLSAFRSSSFSHFPAVIIDN